MTGFAAALTAAEADPVPAAEFLSSRPGFSLRSARDFQKQNPGFLGRALTLEAAAALRSAAEAAGLPCAIFPEEAVKLPPPALAVSRLRPEAAGFHADCGGESVFVKYGEVSMLSAAAWDAPAPPSGHADLKPGLFRRILEAAGVPVPPPARGRLETFFRADLVTAGGLRLLLEPEHMDFTGAPSLSCLENLRLLLERLAAAAPAARSNLFLRRFLAGGDLAPLKLAGPEAAGLELSRLLLTAPR